MSEQCLRLGSYFKVSLLEECNALLASEREQFGISHVFCAYIESRRTLQYVQCPTELSRTKEKIKLLY